MQIEVKVPQLPESVTDATLLDWHKQEGEAVAEQDNLIDLETDKVVLEIPAPQEGVITSIKRQSGETVQAGEVIAIIDTEARAEVQSAQVVNLPQSAKAEALAEETSRAAAGKKLRAGPAARRVAEQHNIDLADVEGSGRGGVITTQDILGQVGAEPVAEAPPPMPAMHFEGERPEKRVPMTRLRARIAERLKQAQQTSAILTTFNEVDMKPAMDLRNRYKADFEKEHGVKLGFMSLFTRAVVEALKKFPIVNASVDGEDIIYHGYYDIGIAVGSPRGLVVPIVRDADLLSFADIEKQIRDYGKRAGEGKLSLEELTGGTFTISNGGVFGSMLSTPILNPPQSAILGMHKIQERPVVENGEIVIRPMMYLALSYDHRIIDGQDAVLFLVAVKEAMEDPSRMLLQI